MNLKNSTLKLISRFACSALLLSSFSLVFSKNEIALGATGSLEMVGISLDYEDMDEFSSLVRRHLFSLGYSDQQITYGMLRLCEWSFFKFGEGLERQEIERLISAYGEEVIGLTFASVSVEEVDENDFQIVKYMIDHNSIKGLTMARVLNKVETLLNEGQNLNNIDIIEQSFYCLVLRPEEIICNGHVIGEHASILVSRFNSYNEKIKKSKKKAFQGSERGKKKM